MKLLPGRRLRVNLTTHVHARHLVQESEDCFSGGEVVDGKLTAATTMTNDLERQVYNQQHMRVNLRDDDNAYAQSRGLHRVVIHGVSALCTSIMRCEDVL